MLHIAICDDDKKERERCREQLTRLGEKSAIHISFVEYQSGTSLLIAAKTGRLDADIIYLDIHMPEIDGVKAAEKLREYGCISEIVFLTVSDRHQLRAFDVEAFNYIIKGNCPDRRFEFVFHKVVKKVEDKKQEYVCFTGGGEARTLHLSSIRYFEIRRRIVTVHYGKDETFEFYSSMEKLESQLLSKGFIRVHRSYIVYLGQIHSLTYRQIKLRDGTIVPLGRSYYQNIKAVMQEKYGLCL